MDSLTILVKDRFSEVANEAANIYNDLQVLQNAMAEAGASHLIGSSPMMRAMATAKNLEIKSREVVENLTH